jgi:hypothetical protein
MAARLAYTSGAMLVVTPAGEHRRVPPGACHIGPYSTQQKLWTVRWHERGAERVAEVSADDLSTYLRGCIVQYA